MQRRLKIVGASALAVIGVLLMAANLLGGSSLHAQGIATTGFDWAKLIIWAGVGFLVVSALLFISASTE
ncbi:MAG TPA: hypothetical protein VLE93_00035 [Candidatus Saccharimonadales bacterium]|nr:hypothetical protein [Candidatus Saccharimonadales bacterium]